MVDPLKTSTRAFAGMRGIGSVTLTAFLILSSALAFSMTGCGGSSSTSSTGTNGTGNGGNGNQANTPTPNPTLTGKMVFSSDFDTGRALSQVYIMNADGTTVTRLTTNSADELASGWSPDGGSILFSSNRDNNGGGNKRDIYTMKGDGTGTVRVTTDTSKNSIDGAWSPDGTLILFASGGQIAVVKADGTNRKTLTGSDVDFALSPIWSPDATRIAFVADTPGTNVAGTSAGDSRSIFVMNADGTGLTPLTTGGEYIRRIAWSPDGQTLVFDSTKDTGGGISGLRQIYRINLDGTNRQRLTTSTANDLTPSWSRDGSRILFSSNRDWGGGTGGTNSFDVYVINPDGTNIGRVTNAGRNPFIAPGGWKP